VFEGPAHPYRSERVSGTQDPIMQLLRAIERPEGTLDLSQGVPFFTPPEGALKRCLSEPGSVSRYGPDQGDRDLRVALSEKMFRSNGIRVDPERELMVTAGANMAFSLVIATVCDIGDEVVLLDPYYFNHRMALDILGVRAVHVDTGKDYLPVAAGISDALSERTRAVVMVDPNNPTGAAYPEKTVREISELCAERGLHLISDETYEDFVYEGRHISPGSLGIDGLSSITIFSFSKGYGMTGWRLGYLSYPDELHEGLLRVQDTFVICPNRASQRLGLDMLSSFELRSSPYFKVFERNRDAVNRWLSQMRDVVEAPRTNGAFYSLPVLGSDPRPGDPLGLVEEVLKRCSVLLVPGFPFGLHDRPALRLSFGNVSTVDLELALERLSEGLPDLLRG